MESDTPKLLPNEKVEKPDPQKVPPKVSTSDAFGGPPVPKQPDPEAEEPDPAGS